VPTDVRVPIGEEGEEVGVEENHPPPSPGFATRIEARPVSTSSRSPSSLKTPTCFRSACFEPVLLHKQLAVPVVRGVFHEQLILVADQNDPDRRLVAVAVLLVGEGAEVQVPSICAA
jgi:hypothetical protein